MKIYIDNDYKCHVSNDGTMREFDASFFDGKCAAFVEGYRYVPSGETWTREDGTVFAGEMAAPWLDSRALMLAQAQYEQSEAEHMAEVAELVEMIYEADMEVIG